jgi:hypothetical protein
LVTSGDVNEIVGFDNIRISAVPEPSAFALIAGFLGLSGVVLRRRS